MGKKAKPKAKFVKQTSSGKSKSSKPKSWRFSTLDAELEACGLRIKQVCYVHLL